MKRCEPFIGIWHLDPNECQYERGLPPRQGTYRIEAEGDLLVFTATWISHDGSENSVAYRSASDGQPHPFENPLVADALLTTVTDLPSLDTATLKHGVVIAFARRELSEDQNSLIVSQSFVTPEGGSFTNVARYRKDGGT